MDRVLRRRGLWFGAFSLLLCVGCRTPTKELESVAKDWCETIRASQVIPVYPLTEDLQPGDVFAVQVPIQQQAMVYREKGFLALDQLVVRLPVTLAPPPKTLPYDKFYGDAYWKSVWAGPNQRPGWLANAAPAPNANAQPALVSAPRAAFPSYDFKVEKGQGLKLAVPIEGVPVGLGLMHSSHATGSVTIRDAYTYGIDIVSLYRALLDWWSSKPEIARTLARVARHSSSEVYLRAVNRVYLTGGMTVSLQNLDASSAGLEAGVAPELELIDLSTSDPAKAKEAAAAYREALDAIGGRLAAALPGGKLAVAQASQRSVTMNETFDRPLVIGYLGFDVRVDEDGALSPPIPSFAVLNGQIEYPDVKVDMTVEQTAFDLLYGNAGSAHREAAARRKIFTDAAHRVGGDFETTFMAELKPDADGSIAFVKAKNHYTNVGSGKEAELRLGDINAALHAVMKDED